MTDPVINEDLIDLAKALANELGKDISDSQFRTVMALLRLFETVQAKQRSLSTKLPYPNARVQQRRMLDPRPVAKMALEERVFDSWLRICLGRKHLHEGWTAGQALDALIDLGWQNNVHDFRANVHRLARELTRLSKRIARHRHLHIVTWADLLDLVHRLGWIQRTAVCD